MSFTVFYRTANGEGGFTCPKCGVRRHDTYARKQDALAAAAEHLKACGAGDEGVAIIDGKAEPAVLSPES